MAGIIYPNVVGTLAPLIQMDQAAQRNAFEMDRIRRQDKLDAEERDAAASLPAAIKGDPAAVAKVTASPKYALPFMQHLEKLDTTQRAKLKEQFEVTGKTAAGILALPEAEQPAAYESAYQNLTAQGYKINLPPKWSPALKNQLQGYAVQVPEYLKLLGDRPTPMGGAAPNGAPAAGGTGNAANAIGGIESGGRYDAVGPVANQKGNRAYGKYQIMDFNVGPWTQEVLGRPMTPQEFLANPQAQDAVFNAKFGQYVTKYGSPQAASRAWFAGEGGMNNPGAKDVLGTSVADYETKFTNALGSGTGGPPAAPAQGGSPVVPAGGGDPEVMSLKTWLSKTIPGARPMGRGGKPIYDSQGKLMILKADGTEDWVEVPKAKDAKGASGPFGGSSVEAQALNMLITNGTLTPQQAAELAAGKTITNPADGSVIFMTPSGLFGQKPGQAPQPVGTPGAAPAAPPAGAQPSATPPGMIPVTPPKPQQMTEGQANAGLYADRMREADAIIARNEKAGLSLIDKTAAGIPVVGNKLVSEEYQLYDQARRNFVNAVLRRESGAVISTEEFANADKQYFPQPGDSDAVLKQKAENRRSAIEGISRAAGPAYKPTANQPAPTQPQAAPENGGEKRLTPEEAQKLPPGTTFIGTDGVQRVRR